MLQLRLGIGHNGCALSPSTWINLQCVVTLNVSINWQLDNIFYDKARYSDYKLYFLVWVIAVVKYLSGLDFYMHSTNLDLY